MILQRQLSRKVGDVEYFKWIVTIPPMIIDEIGWKEGESLDMEVVDGKVVIKKDERI